MGMEMSHKYTHSKQRLVLSSDQVLVDDFSSYYTSPPNYCSGLGSAPTATAHAQNQLYSETKSKVRPKKIEL